MASLHATDERDWASFPGPSQHRPADVPASLRAVAAATAQTSRPAYDRLLFALGNHHRGTLYPVAPACVPFLLGIIANGTDWARWTALEALVDAIGFTAEPRFATMARDGRTIRVDDAFVDAVRAGRDLFARLASAARASSTSPPASPIRIIEAAFDRRGPTSSSSAPSCKCGY